MLKCARKLGEGFACACCKRLVHVLEGSILKVPVDTGENSMCVLHLCVAERQ